MQTAEHLGQNAAVSYACKLRDVTPLEKLVLIALSRDWRINTKYVSCSYGRLGTLTSLAKRTVIRTVRKLERRGLLLAYRSLGGKHLNPTVYRLAFLNPTKTGDGETPKELWERAQEEEKAAFKEASSLDLRKADKNTRRRAASAYSREIYELLAQDEEDWLLHPQREMSCHERQIHYLLRKINADDGFKVKGTRCVQVTQSRKYNCRRCIRRAIFGALCRVHFNILLARHRKQAAKEMRKDFEQRNRPPISLELVT
jgi:hypothetical protein